MRYKIIYILSFMMIVFYSGEAFADTLIMKDGKKVKGLVIEEYTDRITFNTIDGEVSIFRQYIDHIEYDTPEQNFMQLGRAYSEKGWHDKATFYYKKAMDANPDYKEAREAYLASHAKKWREEERRTKKELSHRNMIMEWQSNRRKKKTTSQSKDKKELLKQVIGLTLSEEKGEFRITQVKPYSSADRSGIKQGDRLVGIWSRLIKYSKMSQIIRELLGPKYSEVRVIIERDISVPATKKYEEMGMVLEFEYQGLKIKELDEETELSSLGFKKDDFVMAINGKNTRYLPLDKAINVINDPEDKNVDFIIRRVVNLRREGK